MLERLVENWLVNAGERGFETPFAQLLAAEGHRVLQGPVHHPFEHGKDIITMSPELQLCGFQLKGPDLTRLQDFEEIQGQLFALAAAAINHPALGEPRRPDRVFLVTSATLRPEVRDRIQQFNAANVPFQMPPIEPVEREQLVSRFIAAHGTYLPQNLTDIRVLLDLFYADPATLFPVSSFAGYLARLLPLSVALTPTTARRAIANAALLTAYASASWAKAENHLCTAQAWLTFCCTVLRLAEAQNLAEGTWRDSYELGLEAARTSLASLSKEAAEAEDVVVPHLMEGMVYSSRALLICGYLSAYFLSERTLGGVDMETLDRLRRVLVRERPFVKLLGESEVPAFVELATALGQLGEIRTGEIMMLSLVATLSRTNQRHSANALPDPYHDVEQVLMQALSGDSDLDDEEFDGRSYMLHVGIEWVARRLWRRHLASMWYTITSVELMEFAPSCPDRYLAPQDDDGVLNMWFAGQPQSWSVLLAQSRRTDFSSLPCALRRRREMLPYLPLLLPYRFTAVLAAAVDILAEDPAGSHLN